MNLEELFQCLEKNRREFIARRAEKACFAGSAVPQEENNGEKPANDEAESVLTEVGAGSPAGH